MSSDTTIPEAFIEEAIQHPSFAEGIMETLNDPTFRVLTEVGRERKRQDEKWGQQNHPWDNEAEHGILWRFTPDQHEAKWLVEMIAKQGKLDYAGILTEEYHEALDAETIEQVRAELVQVAAVAVAAIESIDRNGR